MKTKLEKQRHELEEKLTLMENNKYSKPLELIMLRDCLEILTDYSGRDFEEKMNRYLMLNGEDTIYNKEECFGLWEN